MLRFLGVILLSLCVCAMPSYAAVTCGSTGCGVTGDVKKGDAHTCCPANAAADDASHDSKPSSDSGSRPPCAAPCCGYVATVLTVATTHVGAGPLAEFLPTAPILLGAVNHARIFHPPRA